MYQGHVCFSCFLDVNNYDLYISYFCWEISCVLHASIICTRVKRKLLCKIIWRCSRKFWKFSQDLLSLITLEVLRDLLFSLCLLAQVNSCRWIEPSSPLHLLIIRSMHRQAESHWPLQDVDGWRCSPNFIFVNHTWWISRNNSVLIFSTKFYRKENLARERHTLFVCSVCLA